ncbi:hypothetical protein AEAC466_19280 [Asticcacaulis sp. AC466]|uniref:demethoxyubiquinone hydroxylase family protein n=1 Tax=Asticcacaulis sp. AC466 TaxID=1282362 RepID=UPI0003C403FF|nr:demethoxyubiquinone hydroxylase family protein [Asticcacaulis sp. AC466]ESQ82063.1 hypothetical protein AEAC466_19280 [Asticcacaulis sp. AC466]
MDISRKDITTERSGWQWPGLRRARPLDRDIVADILRVDHAGECGAIRIYQAQLWVARWRAPDLDDFLSRTLADEIGHRDRFNALMTARGVRPCRLLGAWGLGGAVLGFVTAVMGRRAILLCTASVERCVHRHLEEQIHWLRARDAAVAEAITAIQVEELAHLDFAEAHGGIAQTAWQKALDWGVTTATDCLIWLSSYGASARLVRWVRE